MPRDQRRPDTRSAPASLPADPTAALLHESATSRTGKSPAAATCRPTHRQPASPAGSGPPRRPILPKVQNSEGHAFPRAVKEPGRRPAPLCRRLEWSAKRGMTGFALPEPPTIFVSTTYRPGDPGNPQRHPLTPGRIINLGIDRIHQPQACVSQSSKETITPAF
jgi:hypothetical protein